MGQVTSNDAYLTVNKQPSASAPGGANAISYPYPVIGIVRDNIDPYRQGSIRVWIETAENVSTDPDDDKSWVTVRFLSPFFGSTQPTAGDDTYGTYKTNPSSYGMWYSPPDIGSKVLCIFVQGKPDLGYWIGCAVNPLLLQMVPAIGGSELVIPNKGEASSMADAVRLPTTNVNTNNPNIAQGNQYLDEPKPVHSYTAAILQQQGLIRDPIRGVISSSATRESPSRVGWGVSTPGRPIYAGGYDDKNITKVLDGNVDQSQLQLISRRGGHSIVMDDGDVIGRDQLIRIRTAGGHQILMGDDSQLLTILHSNGQSYIEFGKEGTIDMYSTNSINMRSQGDINIHADRDVNINGNKNTRINTNGDLELTSAKKTKHLAGTNYELSSGMILTIKGGLGLTINSGGIASFSGTLLTFIRGKLLLLNTLMSPLMAKDVKGSDIITSIDNIWTPDQGFVNVPNGIASICTRVPAHFPWDDSNKGVDLTVDLAKGSGLPDNPTDEVAKLNENVSQLTGQLSSGIMSNSPTLPGIGQNIDGIQAGAMYAAQGQLNAESASASSNNTGFAIVDNNGRKEIKIGPAGMPILQLEQGGILKPGAATLIESNLNKGMPPHQAFATNLFTGKAGAKNFNELIASYTSQASAAVTSYQKSQSQLISTGLITGKADATQEAGVVLSGATQGVAPTVNEAARVSAGNNTQPTAANNRVGKTVALGNQAVGITNTPNKPITAAINWAERNPQFAGKINYRQGTKGAALSVVKESIGRLESGKPVNLGAIAAAKGLDQFTRFSIRGTTQGGLAGYVSNQFINAGNTYKTTFVNSLKTSFRNNVAGTVAVNNAFAQAGIVAQNRLLGLQSTALGAAQSIKAAGLFLQTGQFGLASNALAAGLGNIPGIGGYVTTINNAVQTIRTAVTELPGQIRATFSAISDAKNAVSLAYKTKDLTDITVTATKWGQGGGLTQNIGGLKNTFSGIFGGATGGGVAGVFGAAKAGFEGIVSAGAVALGSVMNIVNSIASIASLFGGKRKIRKGVSRNRTVNRTGINKQIIKTLNDPKIPPPLYIEGVSELQVQELNLIKERARQQALQQGQNLAGSRNPATQGIAGVPQNVINDQTDNFGPVKFAVKSSAVLAAENAQNTQRMSGQIATAMEDYNYNLHNYPQGSPEILASRNSMDSMVSQAQVDSDPLGGSIPTPGAKYRLEQIPIKYRAFYVRFKKLPPQARVLPDGTIV